MNLTCTQYLGGTFKKANKVLLQKFINSLNLSPIFGYLIMKPFLLTLGLIISTFAYSQSCHCARDTMLTESIPCTPAIFENKAKLFWSFNCDSSWLTFESSKRKRKIIFSLGGGFVSLTTRLGYMYWTEFNTTFLITNHVISGCCDPVDYYLFDKSSGNLIKYLGRAIYVSDNKKVPFVVSITNSNYSTFSRKDYNSLSIYNLDSRKEFKLTLPRGYIKKAVKNNDFMFPEDVFETPILIRDILILKYYIEKYTKEKRLNYKTIKIDLNKYNN